MGYSATIIEKAGLTLSLEIDKEIKIEIGTGWNAHPGSSVSVLMEITMQDLDEIIKNLNNMRDQLQQTNICPRCQYINPPENTGCDNCDSWDHRINQ